MNAYEAANPAKTLRVPEVRLQHAQRLRVGDKRCPADQPAGKAGKGDAEP